MRSQCLLKICKRTNTWQTGSEERLELREQSLKLQRKWTRRMGISERHDVSLNVTEMDGVHHRAFRWCSSLTWASGLFNFFNSLLLYFTTIGLYFDYLAKTKQEGHRYVDMGDIFKWDKLHVSQYQIVLIISLILHFCHFFLLFYLKAQQPPVLSLFCSSQTQ